MCAHWRRGFHLIRGEKHNVRLSLAIVHRRPGQLAPIPTPEAPPFLEPQHDLGAETKAVEAVFARALLVKERARGAAEGLEGSVSLSLTLSSCLLLFSLSLSLLLRNFERSCQTYIPFLPMRLSWFLTCPD